MELFVYVLDAILILFVTVGVAFAYKCLAFELISLEWHLRIRG